MSNDRKSPKSPKSNQAEHNARSKSIEGLSNDLNTLWQKEKPVIEKSERDFEEAERNIHRKAGQLDEMAQSWMNGLAKASSVDADEVTKMLNSFAPGYDLPSPPTREPSFASSSASSSSAPKPHKKDTLATVATGEKDDDEDEFELLVEQAKNDYSELEFMGEEGNTKLGDQDLAEVEEEFAEIEGENQEETEAETAVISALPSPPTRTPELTTQTTTAVAPSAANKPSEAAPKPYTLVSLKETTAAAALKDSANHSNSNSASGHTSPHKPSSPNGATNGKQPSPLATFEKLRAITAEKNEVGKEVIKLRNQSRRATDPAKKHALNQKLQAAMLKETTLQKLFDQTVAASATPEKVNSPENTAAPERSNTGKSATTLTSPQNIGIVATIAAILNELAQQIGEFARQFSEFVACALTTSTSVPSVKETAKLDTAQQSQQEVSNTQITTAPSSFVSNRP
jgi:hypothetical protein